jgi:DNA-binding response OmpR family regulator
MGSQRILVIEDTIELQEEIQEVLSRKFPVDAVGTGADALEALAKKEYSLILMDVGLPDDNGFELCAKIRRIESCKSIPIFFLTGRDDVFDKITAFSLGADDYIVKPFNFLELEARVEAKMQKIKNQNTHEEYYTKGYFQVFPNLQKVLILPAEGQPMDESQQQLNLTSIEFRLLTFFLRHDGQNISREEILNEIWGQDKPSTDRTVDTHIYTLRQKLGPLAACIKSVPRVGYRFSQESLTSKNKSA